MLSTGLHFASESTLLIRERPRLDQQALAFISAAGFSLARALTVRQAVAECPLFAQSRHCGARPWPSQLGGGKSDFGPCRRRQTD